MQKLDKATIPAERRLGLEAGHRRRREDLFDRTDRWACCRGRDRAYRRQTLPPTRTAGVTRNHPRVPNVVSRSRNMARSSRRAVGPEAEIVEPSHVAHSAERGNLRALRERSAGQLRLRATRSAARSSSLRRPETSRLSSGESYPTPDPRPPLVATPPTTGWSGLENESTIALAPRRDREILDESARGIRRRLSVLRCGLQRERAVQQRSKAAVFMTGDPMHAAYPFIC